MLEFFKAFLGSIAASRLKRITLVAMLIVSLFVYTWASMANEPGLSMLWMVITVCFFFLVLGVILLGED